MLEKLKKLKDLFAKHDMSEKIKIDLGEAQLNDGVTMLLFPGDAPMVGDPALVVSPDAPQGLPAPEGDVTLMDGTVVSIDANGIISNVQPAAPAAPAAAPQANAEAPMTPQEAKRVIESIIRESVFSKEEVDEKLNAISESLSKFEAIEKKQKEQEEIVNNLFALVEKIASEPAVKPAEAPATFKSDAEKRKDNAVIALKLIKQKREQKN